MSELWDLIDMEYDDKPRDDQFICEKCGFLEDDIYQDGKRLCRSCWHPIKEVDDGDENF